MRYLLKRLRVGTRILLKRKGKSGKCVPAFITEIMEIPEKLKVRMNGKVEEIIDLNDIALVKD